MESGSWVRRRKRKEKVENYYKILGAGANASQQTIKKKYIEAVKAFPPETRPEEFQQVRLAYETLRDPVKRSEYNLLRKFGGQVEDIMKEAYELAEAGRYGKAKELLSRAVHVSPDNSNLRLALAHILLLTGDEPGFQEQCQAALDLVPAGMKGMIMALKARMFLEIDRAQDALGVLEEIRSLYPEQVKDMQGLYFDVYLELGMKEELWEIVRSMLPDQDSQAPEDIYLFINWINVMIELEKWNLLSTVQSRVRKFLKSIKDGEDRLMVLTALQGEHDEYYEMGRFREAEIFIDLAYFVERSNIFIKEQRQRTQEMMRVEKELLRMQRDGEMFSLLTAYSAEWFYKDFAPEEEIRFFRESLMDQFYQPPGVDLAFDEALAESTVYLRRKYPLVYRRFQDRWDEIFSERVARLNREARRRLRVKP